jgi:hypothetical protein
MSVLFEKLNCIKKIKDKETRLRKLKDECSDGDILKDFLEIAKHESSLNLTGAALITALSAILFTVMINLAPDAISKAVEVILFLILYCAVILYIVKIEFSGWTNIYYDLIDLRRERRREPDISKLDIIIAEVKGINQRIDNFEKIVSAKMEEKKRDYYEPKKEIMG